MADDESISSEPHEGRSRSRGSRLPRRGYKRRTGPGNAQRADPRTGSASASASASRRDSQSSTNKYEQPEAKHNVDQEHKREKDRITHRRAPSSAASQESYDLPSPRTPPPSTRPSAANRYTPRIVEDDYDEPHRPPSPSPLPKHSVATAPTVVPGSETSPGIPPAPAQGSRLKGGSLRQASKRRPKGKENPKMHTSVEGQPTPETYAAAVKENPEKQATESELQKTAGQDSDKAMPKDDSFIQVSEPATQQSEQPQEATKTSAPTKANSCEVSTQGSEKTLVEEKSEKSDDGPSQVHDDQSYASALKTDLAGPNGQNGGSDQRQGQDDDDSYPELDDMSMGEVHPPPLPQPNAGIRWAPWNVPFKRRSQTLVVLMHSLCIATTVSIFFALCANPFTWPLLLVYLLHTLSSKAAVDGSLRYRSEWFRKSYLWHLFAGYFPAKLHQTQDLPPTRKYIFGYHPHGIISHGAWAAFATDALGFSEKFPGVTNSLLTLDSNFRIPLYREYVLAMGVRSVSKESIVNILTRGGPNGEGMGRGVTVVVGGARESLEAQPGYLRLILKERKGFIKIAVRTGADLVPVLAFGENNLYDQLRPKEHPFVHKIQMFVLKVWKFTLPFLHGRGIFNYDVGLMPYRRPLNIVVGAPIKVRQSAIVDTEEINRLHELYVAELQKLWDTYKDEFALDRKEEMQILS